MTMRKVREKQCRKRMATISRLSRKRVDRVGSAIKAKWTMREEPYFVRELREERQCIRAEITTITIHALGLRDTNASLMIAERCKRIEAIDKKLLDRWK